MIALAVAIPLLGSGCGSGASPVGGVKVVEKGSVTVKPWCKAQPNAAWKNALSSHVVALSRRASLEPLAVASDGKSFYAYLFSKDYSGIIRIDARTSRYTKIRRVPRSGVFGAEGSADGRWFVWADTTTPYWTKWAIWSWDSTTGRLLRIGATPNAPDAEDWSAISTPSVRDGFVTWAQGSQRGQTDVHVVDLESDRDRIIYHGRAFQPFLLPGHVLLWTEDVSAFGITKPVNVLRAADAVTGKSVAPPAGMRDLRGSAASTLSSDGSEYLHTAGRWDSLWWSPSLRLASHQVFTAPRGNPIDNSLDLHGRYVYFGVQPRAYLADAGKARYLQIGPGGSVKFGKTALVYSKPSARKAQHAISEVVFLPLESLPAIPPCR